GISSMVFPGTDSSPLKFGWVALTDVSERTCLCQSHVLRFSHLGVRFFIFETGANSGFAQRLSVAAANPRLPLLRRRHCAEETKQGN
ncbi:MAG: hypothetical protein LC802_11390, partial [Acidobacteria bacterium]|nr:hypothetical protein [Acidobacteriota bacterium]